MPNDYPDWSTTFGYADTIAGALNFTVSGVPQTVQVAQFSAVVISVQAGNAPFRCTVNFLSSSGAFLGKQIITGYNSQLYSLILPVNCAAMQFVPFMTSGSFNMGVYGSNRPVGAPAFLSDTFNPREFVYSGTPAANFPVSISAADTGQNWTTFNGVCQVDAVCIGNTGLICMEYVRLDATIVYSAIARVTVAGGHTFFSFNHPVTPVDYIFYPDNSTATTVAMYIYPSQG